MSVTRCGRVMAAGLRKNASVICCRLQTPGGVIEHGEHVLVAAGGVLERGQGGVRFLAVPFLEVTDPVQLRLLLFPGAAGERDTAPAARRPAVAKV